MYIFIRPSLIKIFPAGLAVLALPLHLQDCFQLPIVLVEVLFSLPPCIFWLIYVSFVFSLSPVPTHLPRVLTEIASVVVVPRKWVLLQPPVSSPFSYRFVPSDPDCY
jgi:hypothetical protein